MLIKLFRITDEDRSNITFDWVVLAAGVLSLGMAVTLTATHDANAASPQDANSIMIASSTH